MEAHSSSFLHYLPLPHLSPLHLSFPMEVARRPSVSPINCAGDFSVLYCNSHGRQLPDPDVHIVTSGGLRIPAHSGILASVSAVLEMIIESSRKRRSSTGVILILGVPNDAVLAFVGFVYSSMCSEEILEKYGIHLLALAHVYRIPQLKQKCIKDLASQRLSIDNVVDVLQLARLCDAPDLHLKCMKFILNNFKTVGKTEGWKFLQKHDPWLELLVLEFIDEAESRKKRSRRHIEDRSLYLQLNEAMECLEHICTEGCTTVGPYYTDPNKKKLPCKNFSTCHGLQLLIKHFAVCKKRINGGCLHCKRMWQLLRLHSSICDQSSDCRVPLCREFKGRKLQEKRKDEVTWKLLVRNVMAAKAMYLLSLHKRRRGGDSIGSHGSRNFRLQDAH